MAWEEKLLGLSSGTFDIDKESGPQMALNLALAKQRETDEERFERQRQRRMKLKQQILEGKAIVTDEFDRVPNSPTVTTRIIRMKPDQKPDHEKSTKHVPRLLKKKFNAAVMDARFTEVLSLLQKHKIIPVDTRCGDNGNTALMVAAGAGNTSTVSMLLEMGADLNLKNDDQRTAIMKAAAGGHKSIVDLFLSWPDEIDHFETDYKGKTSLDWARMAGHHKVAASLEKAILEVIDKKRRVRYNAQHLFAARTLLKLNEELKHSIHEPIRSNKLHLVMDACRRAEANKLNRASYDEAVAVMNTSEWEKGYFLDTETHEGWTALVRATANNDGTFVEQLLMAGADVNKEVAMLGHNPLSWAAGSGYAAIVKLLIANKANINRGVGRWYETPLIKATVQDKKLVVSILLESILAWSFSERERVKREANESRTEEERELKLKKNWIHFYEEAVSKQDANKRCAMDYAKRLGLGDIIELFKNSDQRVKNKLAREEKERLLAAPTPCGLGCGYVGRADRIKYHEERHCIERLVYCEKECGVKVKFKNVKDHEDKDCENRILMCTNAYFGCTLKMVAKKVEYHSRRFCKKRIVECRLECGETMPWDARPMHEENECQNRIVSCDLKCGRHDLRVRDMASHLHNDCPKRLVPCRYRCGVVCRFEEVEDHMRNACLQPCRWGCGISLAPEDRRKIHEMWICGLRIVQCHLGCNTMGIRAQELEDHETNLCAERLVPCTYGCGKMLKAKLLHIHLHGVGGDKAEHAECPKRPLHCQYEYIDKRLRVYKTSPHFQLATVDDPNAFFTEVEAYSFVARITHFRNEDGCHRFINTHNERFWAKLCDLRFDIIDDGPWTCRLMLENERREHNETECPRRLLKCRNGCGQMMEARFLSKHENNNCRMNKVPCTLGCGRTLSSKDLQKHEETECLYRKVFCECLQYIPFCEFEEHVKGACQARLQNCRRGCGAQVPIIHMQRHLDQECDKRTVPCPLECDIQKMWAQESASHVENDCPHRPVPCSLNCGEMLTASTVEAHEVNVCLERLIPCKIGCGEMMKESAMHDHIMYHCLDRIVKCPQGCPVQLKWKDMLDHEHNHCENRYAMCELGCGLSVLHRNKVKHEEEECIRRGVECPLGCGDTLVAEEVKFHLNLCLNRVIPCGMRATNCKRSIRVWLAGDVENGLGRCQLCEEHGSTGLHWAAGRGDTDLMDYFLTRTNNVDVDQEDKQGLTPLVHACNEGQLKAAQLLVFRGANLDGETSRGYTPLIEAIKEGRTEIALFLAKQGSIINYHNKFRRTAIDWARIKYGETSDEYQKLFAISDMQERHRILLNHILMDRFDEMYLMVKEGIEHEFNAVPIMRARTEEARTVRARATREIANLEEELEKKQPELSAKKKVVTDVEATVAEMKTKADAIHVEVKTMKDYIEGEIDGILFAIQRLKSPDIRSVCDIKFPTPQFYLIMKAGCIMLDIAPKKKRNPRNGEMEDDWWGTGCKTMKTNNFFRPFWNKGKVKIALLDEKLTMLKEFTNDPLLNYDYEGDSSDEDDAEKSEDDSMGSEPRYNFMRLLSKWVRKVVEYNMMKNHFAPKEAEESKLRVDYETMDANLWEARIAYRRVFSDCGVLVNVLDDYRLELAEAENVLAVTSKHLRVAELLSYRGESGHNALTWAAGNGRTEMVEILIDHGASLGYEDDHIQLAAKIIQYQYRYQLYKRRRGKWHKLVALKFKMKEIAHIFTMRNMVSQIRKVRLQIRCPLTEAAYNGHLETVQTLIKRGATMSQKTGLYPTAPPPHLFPSYDIDGGIATLEQIPKYGPVLHQMDLPLNAYECALMGAKNHGHDHWQDGRGWIIRNRWTYTIEFLEKQNRLNRDKINKWLEHRESWLRAKNEIEELRKLDIKCGIAVNDCNFNEVDRLIVAGASCDFENEYGHTPLTMAAACEITCVNQDGTVTPAVSLILDREQRRPNIDHETTQGYTALSWAAKNGRVRTIEVLLDRDAQINRVAKDGKTALLHAAMNGQNDAVRLLIERGADPFQEDKSGKNAIDWALANNFTGVARNIYNAQAGNKGLARANKGKAIILYTCGLGCGKKLPTPEIPDHEATECPKRIVECPEGCGTEYIWAQDLEHHRRHECKKRLLPCTLRCGLLIKEDEMVKHVRKECRRRQIKCSLHCGKKMEFQDLERHVLVDCKHRLVNCKLGCGLQLKYKDQNKHCLTECKIRIVHCTLGCGKEYEWRYLKEHEETHCLFRMVPCRQHCGKEMQFQERPTHEAHRCLQRIVPCKSKCGETLKFSKMSDHLKNDCSKRPVPCPLKCGLDVAFSNVIHHVEHDCTARAFTCSSCGDEMTVADRETHEQHKCPQRLVNCGNGCGAQLPLSQLGEHKQTDCAKRTLTCRFCPKMMYADELDDHINTKCKFAPMFCRFGCGATVIRGKARTHEIHSCPMKITQCSLGCGTELREKDREYHEREVCIRKHSAPGGNKQHVSDRGHVGTRGRTGSSSTKARLPRISQSRATTASSSNAYGSSSRGSTPSGIYTPASSAPSTPALGTRAIATPMSMPALSRNTTPVPKKNRLSKTAGGKR